MCDGRRDVEQTETKSDKAKRAGNELARLMERQLGYRDGHIDNIALRLFIQAHWGKVCVLAHAIHEDVA